MKLGLQSKYSVSIPVFVDCQKDSETTVGNRTQVKPVVSTVIRFAVPLMGLGKSQQGML